MQAVCGYQVLFLGLVEGIRRCGVSQKFGIIDPNKNIGECNTDINEALLALVSSFSGTAFPTNVWPGMLCYRTDERKLYQLKSVDSLHDWVLIADLTRSGTDAITAERLARARSINGVAFDGTKDIVLDTTRSFTAPKTAAGSVDFNTLLNAGTYDALVSGMNPNGPSENDLFYVNVYVSGTNVTQLATGYKNNKCYLRNRNTNTWSRWECLVRASDLPAKLPADGGNADTVDGAHAGNAANNVLKLDGNARIPRVNLPLATSTELGIVKQGKSLKINDDGSIEVSDLNTTGSLQVKLEPVVSASTPASYAFTMLGQAPGVAKGVYALEELLKSLVNISHSHALVTKSGTNCNCACACDCQCGDSDGACGS